MQTLLGVVKGAPGSGKYPSMGFGQTGGTQYGSYEIKQMNGRHHVLRDGVSISDHATNGDAVVSMKRQMISQRQLRAQMAQQAADDISFNNLSSNVPPNASRIGDRPSAER
jgi:hypothetical protein